jgi:sterol desaturase/sphingolipid hydroxylase (fatty acid hydroxylase superfamily)
MLHAILERWQPVAALAGFLLFWCWESLAPFFQVRRRVRHAARNLAVAGINAVAIALLFASATVAVSEWGSSQQIGLLHLLGLPTPVQVVFAFLLLDVWTYWWHRANHRIPLLWRFHRMHHSDPSMDVSTATRFHVGEIAISSGLRMPVIVAAGVPLGVIVVYDFTLLLATQFHHANVGLPSELDRWLRCAIVSPNMHKIHHSRQRIETDSNYSSVLSVWDRLFRTFRERDDYHRIEYGVDGFDDDARQTFAGLLATPLERPRAEPKEGLIRS